MILRANALDSSFMTGNLSFSKSCQIFAEHALSDEEAELKKNIYLLRYIRIKQLIQIVISHNVWTVALECMYPGRFSIEFNVMAITI